MESHSFLHPFPPIDQRSFSVAVRSASQHRRRRKRSTAMRLLRRFFLRLAAGAVALPAVPCIARAQAYPTRPIRLVIPFPQVVHSTPSDARWRTR
jgi:hypothetical protein